MTKNCAWGRGGGGVGPENLFTQVRTWAAGGLARQWGGGRQVAVEVPERPMGGRLCALSMGLCGDLGTQSPSAALDLPQGQGLQV